MPSPFSFDVFVEDHCSRKQLVMGHHNVLSQFDVATSPGRARPRTAPLPPPRIRRLLRLKPPPPPTPPPRLPLPLRPSSPSPSATHPELGNRHRKGGQVPGVKLLTQLQQGGRFGGWRGGPRSARATSASLRAARTIHVVGGAEVREAALGQLESDRGVRGAPVLAYAALAGRSRAGILPGRRLGRHGPGGGRGRGVWPCRFYLSVNVRFA